jgi:phage shock protein C
MNNKHLHRIQSESVLGGVAAGFADYFNIDKALMRVIFVILMLFTKVFPILLLYIILWAVLPTGEPTVTNLGTNWSSPNVNEPKREYSRGAELIGYALLLIGGFMLFDRLFYWMHLQKFIPAALLIGIGLFLILRHNNKTTTTIADSEPATPSWTDSAPINDWQPPKTSESTETTGESEEPKA